MAAEFDFHIAVTLAFVVMAAVLFAWDRLPTEAAALVLLAGLLAFFHFFPLPDQLLDMERLLAGFGNPALVAVVALLVLGEALVQTDALNAVGRLAARVGGSHPWRTISAVLLGVAAASGVVNNTPLVIIFIPIMQAMAQRLRLSSAKVMMPLSFATILGGMTTLLGSSTNLLVSTSLIALERRPLGIFEVTPIGIVVAAVGLAYLFLVAPRLLPERAEPERATVGADGRQFVAQLQVTPESRLIGQRLKAGLLRDAPDLVVRAVLRGDASFMAALEELDLKAGDILMVTATRRAIADVLVRNLGLEPYATDDSSRRDAGQILTEVMVVPRSPLIGQSLEQIQFSQRSRCVAVALRRRGQTVRQRMSDMPLESGDVLLVQCTEAHLRELRGRHEVVVLEGTASDLPEPHKGARAVTIFAAVVAMAVTGVMPIAMAAILGAAAMVLTGTLGVRQAFAAIDRRIIMLVGSALALGEAMEATGAAAWLADVTVRSLEGASPGLILSAFFGLILAITNILSNNACAVLFTPIAVGIAERLGMDPHIFALAVLIAADASFATPIGYQTNLLVMGPGRYRFRDFMRVGIPLSLLVWVAFVISATVWFDLSW